MKKYIVSLLIAAAMVSCSKEPEMSLSGAAESFTASVPNVEGNKTTISFDLQNHKAGVAWELNDSILVNMKKYLAVTSGGTATFQNTGSVASQPFYAFYPCSIAVDNTHCILPAEQEFINGKAGNLPMFASAEKGTNLSFHNICGALQITLKNDVVVNKIIVTTTGYPICGYFSIENNKAVYSSGSIQMNDYTVTLNCNNYNSKDVNFLVALPEKKYTKLTVTVVDIDGKEIVREKDYVQITANQIKPIIIEND